MSCTGCASTVESALRKVKGVIVANVNFAGNTAWVEYDEALPLDQLVDSVRDAGYKLVVTAEENQQDENKYHKSLFIDLVVSAIFSVPVFIIGMFFHHRAFAGEIMFACTLIVMLTGGRKFFAKAIRLAVKLNANMDTLVALGTGVAFTYSSFVTFVPSLHGESGNVFYEGAAVVITFILLGRYLEENAKSKTGESIRALLNLQPANALVYRGGEFTELPVAQVLIGDRMMIRPGSRLPVDGNIVSGESWIDESLVSGESKPIFKSLNDPVTGGTMNGEGNIEIVATAIGKDSFLSRIVEQVKSAQCSKAPVQEFLDRVSSVFVPIVITLAIVTFAAWMFSDYADKNSIAIVSAVSILVVACPCALGLATPAAVAVAIGMAARRGILIRNARAMEELSQVNLLFVDKTGTLTEGKPRVLESWWKEGLNEKEKQICSQVASVSTHPLSKAVVRLLANQGTDKLSGIREIKGCGMELESPEGMIRLGSLSWLNSTGVHPDENLSKWLKGRMGKSGTKVFFSIGEEIQACFLIGDEIREGAAEAILKIQKAGIKVILITGDNQETAEEVAQITGIGEFHAGCIPERKLELIRKSSAQGLKTAMVGDGINDAPALAAADVGLAIGDGSDVASETAGIILTGGGIKNLASAIRVSQLGRKTIRQNLFWAFLYNILALPLAAGLFYPVVLEPMLAGLAMAFSSFSVMLNSLSLRLRSI